jgi:hypothetical protein
MTGIELFVTDGTRGPRPVLPRRSRRAQQPGCSHLHRDRTNCHLQLCTAAEPPVSAGQAGKTVHEIQGNGATSAYPNPSKRAFR